MSTYNAPQTEVTYPYDATIARSGLDTNLTNGQSPQQAGVTETYRDAIGAPYVITYASTITPARSNGRRQKCTLTGNVTIGAPTAAYAGQVLDLVLVQNTAGSNTATWNSVFKFSGGSKTLSTTGGTTDIASFFYDGTSWLGSLTKSFR